MNQQTTFADWSQLFDDLADLLHNARASASRLDNVRQWREAIETGTIDGLTIRGMGKHANQRLELHGEEVIAVGRGLASEEARTEKTLRLQLELLKERTASLL